MIEIFGINKRCELNQFIAKKNFLSFGTLSKTDKELLSKNVNKITLMYQLDKTKANISPYKDELREYNLINVFFVELNEDTKTNKIATFIMNAIPYPNVIVFSYKGKIQLAVAHQRINQNDSEKNVLEPLTISRWFDDQETLFDISKMNMNNCYTLYCDIADFISIQNARQYTSAPLTGEQARQIQAKIEEIDAKIAALKAKINKETQFNNRVEMNMQIRKLKKERETLTKI